MRILIVQPTRCRARSGICSLRTVRQALAVCREADRLRAARKSGVLRSASATSSASVWHCDAGGRPLSAPQSCCRSLLSIALCPSQSCALMRLSASKTHHFQADFSRFTRFTDAFWARGCARSVAPSRWSPAERALPTARFPALVLRFNLLLEPAQNCFRVIRPFAALARTFGDDVALARTERLQEFVQC